MLQLGKILPGRVREVGLARNIVIAQILAEARNWIAISFGEETAKRIILKSLVRGEMVMHTEYPALAQNLRLNEAELVRHINSKFGGNILVRLRWDTN